MHLKTLLACIAFASCSLSSCKEDNEELASRSVIDGVWETACVANADQSSHKVRYTFFENNTVRRQENFFSDAACTQARGVLVHRGGYDLAVRTEISLYEIDFFYTEAMAIPANAEGAAAWNAQHFCGLTRWLPAVDEDVIAQTDPACGVYGISRLEYRDLVQVDEEKSLVFGAQLNNNFPRPTAVDSSNPLNVFLWTQP